MTNANLIPKACFARLGSLSISLLISALGGILCLPFTSASAEEHCSPEMNNQAVSLLRDAGKNWQSLLEHQKRFVVCDDGELGEGYSDAVARLFSRNWSQFSTFADISRNDPAFQHWAVGHIDASASSTDLKAIAHNASVCAKGKGARNLCKIIQKAAENALVESGQKKP